MESLVIFQAENVERLFSVVALLSSLYLWRSLYSKGAQVQFDKTGLENYITDQQVESNTGVWLPPFPGDRSLKILRAGGSNKKFSRAFQQAIKPHRRAMERGTLDSDVSDALMRDVYSKHIVVDWRNINDAEGNPVPCTPENVKAFFTALPEIFTEVVAYASEVATFAEENLEEAKETLGEV
jgi:hypothetical protein